MPRPWTAASIWPKSMYWPDARAAAVVERGDERDCSDVRDEEVRVGDARADGLRVGPAGQVVEAGGGLEDVSVAHVARPGAGLAVERHGDHHEVFADTAQRSRSRGRSVPWCRA